MLPPVLGGKTIGLMAIVSFCVCAPSVGFISNYSISKSIRRVSPSVVVVYGRSLADIRKTLKYVGYYLVSSTADTHVLLKACDEVRATHTEVSSGAHPAVTSNIEVNNLKFTLVAAPAVSKSMLVRTMKKYAGEPVMVTGVFEQDPFEDAYRQTLWSLGAAPVTKENAVGLAPAGVLAAEIPPRTPAIVVKNVRFSGTGTYVLARPESSPSHLWIRATV